MLTRDKGTNEKCSPARNLEGVGHVFAPNSARAAFPFNRCFKP